MRLIELIWSLLALQTMSDSSVTLTDGNSRAGQSFLFMMIEMTSS